MGRENKKGGFRPPRSPLKGERLSLAPLTPSDIEAAADFFADAEALYYYLPDLLLPRTSSQLQAMMDEWNDGRNNFVFACRYEGQTIGLVTLSDLDAAMGHGEAGVMLTDRHWQGRGFGREAMELMLAYAFGELGLHRVYARVAAENLPSLKLFRSLGFVEEGRMREAMRRSGRYMDLILFGLLESEFRQEGRS